MSNSFGFKHNLLELAAPNSREAIYTATVIVRREHSAAFMDRKRAEVCDFMVAFLQRELPRESSGLPDRLLWQHCSASFDCALYHGLTDYRSIAWLAATRLVIHPEFDRHPRIEAALSDASRSSEIRIQSAIELLSDALVRKEISARHDLIAQAATAR